MNLVEFKGIDGELCIVNPERVIFIEGTTYKESNYTTISFGEESYVRVKGYARDVAEELMGGERKQRKTI